MIKHFSTSTKRLLSSLFIASLLLLVVSSVNAQGRRRGVAGKAFEGQVTPYKTTMMANGNDEVSIKVAVIDGVGDVMTDAANPVRFSIKGDARITRIQYGDKTNADAKVGDTTV